MNGTCPILWPVGENGRLTWLGCDLDDPHPGLNHHDPVYGIWWQACALDEHGHDKGG